MDGVTGDPAHSVTATLNYLRPGSPRNRLYVAPGGHLTTTQYALGWVIRRAGRAGRAGKALDGAQPPAPDVHAVFLLAGPRKAGRRHPTKGTQL